MLLAGSVLVALLGLPALAGLALGTLLAALLLAPRLALPAAPCAVAVLSIALLAALAVLLVTSELTAEEPLLLVAAAVLLRSLALPAVLFLLTLVLVLVVVSVMHGLNLRVTASDGLNARQTPTGRRCVCTVPGRRHKRGRLFETVLRAKCVVAPAPVPSYSRRRRCR